MKNNRNILGRAAGMTITQRDIELIKTLASCGVFTRPQIQILLNWDCVSDVNRRLAKLVQGGYLIRRPAKAIDAPAIYVLGVEAVKLLHNSLNVDPTVLNQRRFRLRNLSDGLLTHELTVSQFACIFRAALNGISDAKLRAWIPADELISLCNIIEDAGDQTLRPDAFASYQFGKLVFNFFLEADLGTEPLSRIEKKVNLYRAFKASGLFIKNFGSSAFRILIVTISDKRLENIAVRLSTISDIKVFAANLDKFKNNFFVTPAWHKPGLGGACRIHTQTELRGSKEENATLS